MPRKRKMTARDSKSTTKRPRNERDTVVMFVDIIGASEVSNHMSLKEYAHFISEFQLMFTRICMRFMKRWYDKYSETDYEISTRGDEGLLMFYLHDSGGDVSTEVDCAVSIALELKREWLWSKENKKRIIKHGLLPVGLAVGIHAGKTFLRGEKEKKPEGYTINLAKRVESYSRNGRFSNIFLSEAAFGYLKEFSDEVLYLVEMPEPISPKGISRDIRAYEIKHHFLPSDWIELSKSSKRARSLLDPRSIDLPTLKRALKLNPTNLWLNNEFIRSSMLRNYWNLDRNKRELKVSLRKAFEPALTCASIMRQSEQRDAGTMFIVGLIYGEQGDYDLERLNYTAAIKSSDQIAEAYWYRGASFSYEVWEKLNYKTNIKYDDELDKSIRELVDKAIDDLREARHRRPQCAWILYDYGCELIRWNRSKEERSLGIENLLLAMISLDSVRESAKKEMYISSVRDVPKIKKLLQMDAD